MFKIYQIRHDIPGKETISNIIVTEDMKEIYSCYLVELSWQFNQKNISCIPVDKYILKKLESSPAFDYPHFEVLNVPGRSGIKWHVANYARQLRGCGAPGERLADLNHDGVIDVASSGNALKELLSILPDETELVILNG